MIRNERSQGSFNSFIVFLSLSPVTTVKHLLRVSASSFLLHHLLLKCNKFEVGWFCFTFITVLNDLDSAIYKTSLVHGCNYILVPSHVRLVGYFLFWSSPRNTNYFEMKNPAWKMMVERKKNIIYIIKAVCRYTDEKCYLGWPFNVFGRSVWNKGEAPGERLRR